MRHLAIAGAIVLALASPAHAARHHASPRVGVLELVTSAARRHHVPMRLMYGIVSTESGFDPRAHNRSGAAGLGQIMPATARGLGCRGNLFSAAVNADCTARYLARLLAVAHGNERLAAALYTVGEAGNPRRAARYVALVMARARRVPS